LEDHFGGSAANQLADLPPKLTNQIVCYIFVPNSKHGLHRIGGGRSIHQVRLRGADDARGCPDSFAVLNQECALKQVQRLRPPRTPSKLNTKEVNYGDG
jgi:hypothetical protein